MSPRPGKPKQGKDGERAIREADKKLKSSDDKGKYGYPGRAAREARKGNA